MKKKSAYFGLCICAFAAAMLVTGCKKDSDLLSDTNNGPYYVKFKANGESKKFSQVPLYPGFFHDTIDIGAGIKKHIYQFGMGSNNLAESLSFAVLSYDTLRVNREYKETDYIDPYTQELMFSYSGNPPGSGFYFSSSMYALSNNSGIIQNCSLTVTELGLTHIKGHFSGMVYFQNINTGDPELNKKIVITEGEFFLQIQN